jgi:hypothetical protein
MHVTWLVSNPDRFFENPGPTSPADRIVPGLNYREWYTLFFVELGVDGGRWGPLADTDTSPRPDQFNDPVPEYPMLSRINGVYFDAVFKPDEIEALEEECKRLAKWTSNSLALNGLRKLLAACVDAKALSLGIYMMCD